jgi:hypothetical protein
VNIANAERIGTYVTIEVQGHGASQNGLWFLELDDGGIVVDAIDRN